MKTTVKKRLVSQANYVYDSKVHAEPKNMEPSMTVPGESYTVKEIFERFTRNAPLNDVQKEPSFDSAASFDSEDFEKLQHMEPFERNELLIAYRARVADLQKIVDEDRAKAEGVAKEEAELQSEMKKSFLAGKKASGSAQDQNDAGAAKPPKGGKE